MSIDSNRSEEASVIVPLFRRNNHKIGVLFILRCSGGLHGNQIAFPGGKREKKDDTPLQTALRETREEIGLNLSSQNILEYLDPVKTQTTGYLIYPFLAKITLPEKWILQQKEVNGVITAGVEDLLILKITMSKCCPSQHGQSHEKRPLSLLMGINYGALHIVS